MLYFRPGMLIALCFFMLSCSTNVVDVNRIPRFDVEEMFVDFDRKEIRIGNWNRPFDDCSNSAFNCLNVRSIMIIAFPKKCDVWSTSALGKPGRRLSPAGEFIVVAPTPHYGLPSGSYVSSKHPYLWLLYKNKMGFSEVRVLKHSPNEKDFDPNLYTARYQIVADGKVGIFACE